MQIFKVIENIKNEIIVSGGVIMKVIDKIREEVQNDVLSLDDINDIMSSHQYIQIEDEDDEADILKYSNGKSQIWLKYISDGEEYIINEVTRRTKKRGKTEGDPFYREEDIKLMLDYFRSNNKYVELTIVMLEMLLARRIGDTLSLRWSDFYYETGKRKTSLNTLVEEKTDKIIEIAITDITWKYLDLYCEKMNINPLDDLNEFVFPTEKKSAAKNAKELKVAIDKHAASFRHTFKKMTDVCGLENINTHSLRKTFGHIVYELNKYDPDCLPVEQTIFGHDSMETTKRYIGIMKQKSRKYFSDMGEFIDDVENGRVHSIDNMPVIAVKTNDLREILYNAIKSGREEETDIAELLNRFISMVEVKRMM